jgi:ankyrin repeat protein
MHNNTILLTFVLLFLDVMLFYGVNQTSTCITNVAFSPQNQMNKIRHLTFKFHPSTAEMSELINIDDLFDSCKAGTLDVSVLSSLPHAPSIRNSENHSLLDVAIEYKHVNTVQSLLQRGFLPTAAAKAAALRAAASAGDLAVFKLVAEQAGLADPLLALCSLAAASECGHIDMVRYILAVDPRLDLNTALFYACVGGNTELVRELITRGADAHLPPGASFIEEVVCAAGNRRRMYMPDGSPIPPPNLGPVLNILSAAKGLVNVGHLSLWHGAGRCGNIPFINSLFILGCDQNRFDSLLAGACEGGHAEVVRFLFTMADTNGYTISYCKLGNKNWYDVLDGDVLDTILTRYVRDIGFTASKERLWSKKEFIWWVVARGCASAVKEALRLDLRLANEKRKEYIGGMVGRTNYVWETVLSCAGDAATVRELLKRGAEASPHVSKGSISVLRSACLRLDPAAVQLLLQARASVHSGRDGQTPLRYAIHAYCAETRVQDKISVINLLIDAGANTRGGVYIQPALNICVDAHSDAHPVAVVAALLERDPGLLEDRYMDFITPLQAAVYNQNCNPSVIRALIDAGANVNAKKRAWETSLVSRLCFNSKIKRDKKREILHMLLEASAEAQARDSHGNTQLMIIAKHCYSDDAVAALFISDMLDYIKAHGVGREAGESVGDEADAGADTGTGTGTSAASAAVTTCKATRARTGDADIKADEDVDEEEPPRKRTKSSI